MAQDTTVRFNTASLRKLGQQLERWIGDTQDSLDNEESKDYPSETRIDEYTDRLDALQTAYDALEVLL